MQRERTLTPDEARSFYDQFGARQDSQAFYEDPPNQDMVQKLDLGQATSIFEFGCGTGRLAETLLAVELSVAARYCGIDLSQTMVDLARQRLRRFGERAEVLIADGSMNLPAQTNSVDRFVSTFVLDLLSRADIEALVTEAHRILRPGGLAGVTSLTQGRQGFTRAVSWIWTQVHRLRPRLVGGCRPLELTPFFPAPKWKIEYQRLHVNSGLTSQVLVARKL